MISCSRLALGTLAAVLLAGLGGCSLGGAPQDDPTRYYILSDAALPAAAADPHGLRIGLRTPALGSYLKRREMVVRDGANEVTFEDYRRWAESLEAGIPRLVRARLLASPAVASAAVEPFPIGEDRDYDVAVEVRHCEGATAGDGHMVARFSATVEIITAGADPAVVVRKVFNAPDKPWDGTHFDQLANLLSQDVTALGAEILADLPARR